MMDIARACKELFPDKLIFAGGGVPTNMYEKILETSDIDIMLFGEVRGRSQAISTRMTKLNSYKIIHVS